MKNYQIKLLGLSLLATLFFTACSKSDDDSPEENLVFEIGQEYQGGIIFYLDESEKHGLIAFQSDLASAVWGCLDTDPEPPNTEPPSSPIAQNEGIGFGLQNTLAILNFCDEPLIAARSASNLSANGYDDWYLPSIEELRLVYENRDLIGGFPNLNNDPNSTVYPIYSSSSEGTRKGDGNGGYYYLNYYVFDFADDTVIPNVRKVLTSKSSETIVRPVRSF